MLLHGSAVEYNSFIMRVVTMDDVYLGYVMVRYYYLWWQNDPAIVAGVRAWSQRLDPSELKTALLGLTAAVADSDIAPKLNPGWWQVNPDTIVEYHRIGAPVELQRGNDSYVQKLLNAEWTDNYNFVSDNSLLTEILRGYNVYFE